MPMILTRVMREELDPPSALNVHLNRSWDLLIRHALRKRPADRFQTAEQFLCALHLAAVDRYEDPEIDRDDQAATVPNPHEGATVLRPRRPVTS